MISNKKSIIIFSGYNQRAVIAFLRTLVKNKINNFIIVAKNEEDEILQTSYRKNVNYIRKKKELDLEEFTDIINFINKKLNIKQCIIAPSTEAINRFILKNKEYLEKINYIIPICDENIYKSISDKESFGRICSEYGLNIPKEVEIKNKYLFPLVAKPKSYYAKSNKHVYSPILITNEEVLSDFLLNYNTEDFYYQEFIYGRSIYLLFYFCKNGLVYKFSQENYMQQGEGKSIIAAVNSYFHKESITNEFENMFRGLGYNGFVMVEIRLYKGIYYVIEANPRFWGPSQLFVDCNCNFFEVFLSEYGFIIPNIKFKEPEGQIKYFWSSGIDANISQGISPVYYNDFKKYIKSDYLEWKKYDVYNREDTKKIL